MASRTFLYVSWLLISGSTNRLVGGFLLRPTLDRLTVRAVNRQDIAAINN